MDDSGLRAVLDELVAAGTVLREGRRLRLPGHEPAMDPEMRARVDRLLAGLREAGAEPPRVDGVAARLGVPPFVLDQLRDAGKLVSLAPGIDYPRDMYDELLIRLDELAARGPLTVARVRDALRTSRRYAEALIARRRSERRRGGRR